MAPAPASPGQNAFLWPDMLPASHSTQKIYTVPRLRMRHSDTIMRIGRSMPVIMAPVPKNRNSLFM